MRNTPVFTLVLLKQIEKINTFPSLDQTYKHIYA